MSKKLVWVESDYQVGLKYLQDFDFLNEYGWDDCKLCDPQPPLTVQALCNYADSELENANYHSACGMYKKIAEITIKHVGEEKAIKIIEDLIMNGRLFDL